MIRTLQPTDLSGLLLLTARSLPNLARPRERLGERPGRSRAARDLVAHWVPSGKRHHTFLYTQGRRIGGLLSCRSRPDLNTWEVDRLLLLSTEEEASCMELLGRLGSRPAEAGIQRLFLRLSAESPILTSARRAGFSGYMTEHLFVRDNRGTGARDAVASLSGVRPRQPQDDYALFRLYNRVSPISVRLAEGLALQEWKESMEVRWASGRRGTELVLEREGEPVAWLRTAAGGLAGYLSLIVHPTASSNFAHMIRLGLQRLSGRAQVFLLLPDHQSQHMALLAEMGFEKVGEYVSFVREAVARVKSPGLVPARVT